MSIPSIFAFNQNPETPVCIVHFDDVTRRIVCMYMYVLRYVGFKKYFKLLFPRSKTF